MKLYKYVLAPDAEIISPSPGHRLQVVEVPYEEPEPPMTQAELFRMWANDPRGRPTPRPS